jgi:peroxiredoxin
VDPIETTNRTDMEARDRRKVIESGRVVVAAGIVLLVASVSLNVILAQRVWSFTHLQSIKAAERLLKVGATVPAIAAKRLNGQPGVISYQGTEQSTVLYIFTPPCSWCARNLDNFKTLLDKESGQYHFIGLSLSEKDLAEYVAKNELKLPVYSSLSPETMKTYKLGSTPQTIVISPEGKVLQDWVGAYVSDQKSQVEAFFRVSLPGLRELPKAEASKN